MDYSRELFDRTGRSVPADGGHEQCSGIQSVQNLETVINEGLRVALLEENPRIYRVGMTTLMSGQHKEFSRKKKIFKIFPQRCVQAGIGTFVLAGTLLLSVWKTFRRPTRFSMRI